MNPGPRTHKQATLRVAICEALPVEMWERTRELIAVRSEDRGKGHASALMWQVCAEADKAWLTLIVQPAPFDNGPPIERLRKWYTKFGFVEIQAEPCIMSRSPAPPKCWRSPALHQSAAQL